MTSVRVIGPLDHGWAWDGEHLVDPSALLPFQPAPALLRGALGTTTRVGDAWRIVRDPQGLGKLFWGQLDGELLVSARPWRLTEAGVQFSALRAIPAGSVIDIDPAGIASIPPPARWRPAEGTASLLEIGSRVRPALEGYLDAVAKQALGSVAVVCLSGGIDSTVVALAARACFDRVLAVSFDLVEGDDSADRKAAAFVAEELSIELVRADTTEAELLSYLDLVLLEGVDWRPFNVHAALVNAALANRIAALRDEPGLAGTVVLTGDIANELLADYQPVVLDQTLHYRLPSVAPRRLRSALVAGLESTHREIGVFGAFGLDVVQPYAALIDDLTRLDPRYLGDPGTKVELALRAFGTAMPPMVLDRPKVRAQVGGPAGGVLRVLHRAGIDEAALRRRFASLHAADELAVARAWRTGRFRSGLPPDDLNG